MRRPVLAALFVCLAATGAIAVTGAGVAAAATQTCVDVTDGVISPAPGGQTPTPGAPCWVSVAPYPFGYAGQPLDGRDQNCTGPGTLLYERLEQCELQVQSFAFRAWNRGLAVVGYSPDQMDPNIGVPGSSSLPPNPYEVWLYNGTRWFPNPTFPGEATCQGNTIVWAGKLDYWLIGAGRLAGNWPSVCRFDGVNFTWEPLSVPAATKATPEAPGVIPALRFGACLAWDDCWFFGDGGAQAHWDGQSLTNVPQTGPYTVTSWSAAWAGTDSAGYVQAYALGRSIEPDGTTGPGVFRWNGSTFAPFAGTPDPPEASSSQSNLADNDAWATATQDVPNPAGEGQPDFTLQALLHYTDGQTPNAPAGDDYEPRPGVFQPEPSLFELVPPVSVPPPPPPSTRYQKGATKHEKAAIYGVRKPKLSRGPHKALILTIRFMVRRKVTIGIEGLRGHTVVARSGLKVLEPGPNELTLRVDRKHWPNHLKWQVPAKR